MIHSHCSPSAFSRYIECNASYKLEKLYACDQNSKAADRGRLLHELLGKAFEAKALNSQVVLDGEDVTDDVHFAYNKTLELASNNFDKLQLEKQLNLDFICQDMFGTCDCFFVVDDKLVVIDYKFGRVKVSAKDNHQLKLYMLGVLKALPQHEYKGLKTAELYIIQNCYCDFESFDITSGSLGELVEFYRNVTKKCLSDNPEFNVGKACTYCKAKHFCPKLSTELSVIKKDELKLLSDISEDEIANIYRKKDLIKKYLEEVEKYIYNKLQNGEQFLNFTLAQKKGKASWKENAEKELEDILGDKAFQKKIITITEAKKLVDKDVLQNLLEHKLTDTITELKEVNFNF